ncbi:MAG: TraU family protein [Pseudomonadota bacterium]|nr:TraU family protein [Pseudomonadota bacterium]
MARGIRLPRAALFALLLAFGVDDVPAEAGCPDAGVFSGKLITDICWSCIFPIRALGMTMGGEGRAPSKASSDVMCWCDDQLGVPHPGGVVSMWEPARLIEIVRMPGCSATLGGIELPVTGRRMHGKIGEGENDGGDLGFWNYHYYAFPLLVMMELFVDDSCSADGFMDFDLMYLSELDPTWNNPELAFFTQPEAAAFANPAALAACATEAAAVAVDEPIDSLFWCAGSWGGLYPFTGYVNATGGMPQQTSIAAVRALASMHRRGLARRTMGADVQCKAKVEPILPKSQYKLTMFFPVPETSKAHPIGQSPLIWGRRRTIPHVGEDAVYTLWRWNDCCIVY